MRSVFIDSTLATPPFGGATTFLVELCGALAARGDQVTVVTDPGPDHSIARRLRACGVEVRFDIWHRAHLPEERAQRLVSWIHKERANVFVISISPDAGWLALPLLPSSVATISIAHADGPAFYEPLKHYAPWVDCAIGVSESIRKRIVEQCKISPRRARHVPYGVRSLSREEFEARSEVSTAHLPLRIAYVGRLIQGLKRALDLVPLAAELVRREIDFELHVVGDGPDRQELEAGFRTEGVLGKVTFWGWLAPEDVSQRLRELDTLVLLSDSEGLPLALLESMGHGVVPVVTNLETGMTEVVINNVNGFLAPVNNAPAFADRLQILADDRQKLSHMSRTAWQTAQEYSAERMVQRYVSCFTELLDPRLSREYRQTLPKDYPVMASCRSRYPFWMRKLKHRFLSVAAGIVA